MKVDPATVAEWERRGLVEGTAPPAAPAKYRNVKVEYEGHTFDSKKEFRRWLDLIEEQKAGRISELRRQVEFELVVNGVLIGHLVLDFVYVRGGVTVYEDVKSKPTITPLFKWKQKHFEAQYQARISLYL